MKKAASSSPKPLDHLVLPVTDLDAARARLTALGFSVAPEGIHPFGTANACVFFEDGTFIEPLALADVLIASESARSGNTFVRHFLDYQKSSGSDGFSALVFKSSDAIADHYDYREKGISKGEVVTFARDFTAPDGSRDRAEFRLAFAMDKAAPDCLFFACERVAVPKVDRSALQRHANGATKISRVYLSTPDVEALVPLLTGASGGTPQSLRDGGQLFQLGGTELRIVSPEKFAADFGIEPRHPDKPHFCAVLYSVSNIAAVENQMVRSNVAFRAVGNRLVVAPEKGQGAAFIFMSQEAG